MTGPELKSWVGSGAEAAADTGAGVDAAADTGVGSDTGPGAGGDGSSALYLGNTSQRRMLK